ncbi:MAG: HAD family hydrolase, partial [Acidimicrobiales bacterium]
MIDVIALDGDDTLWHSEHLFVDTQDRFRALVRPYVDVDDATLDARLLEVERRNLPLFGYGVKAFTLSLLETAIEVTDGRIPGRDLQAVLDLGKVLMDHPVDLLDGVRDAVDALTDRYRVMVITKGDLLHQETKVARSGLDELFWRVEIV